MKNVSLKKILVATLVALVISLFFVGVLTLVVYFAELNDSTVSTLVLAASVISVLVGAFVLARNITGGGLINGLVLGILYCLILLGVSLLINGSVAIDFSNVTRLIIIIAAAMLGGVVGINSAN